MFVGSTFGLHLNSSLYFYDRNDRRILYRLNIFTEEKIAKPKRVEEGL